MRDPMRITFRSLLAILALFAGLTSACGDAKEPAESAAPGLDVEASDGTEELSGEIDAIDESATESEIETGDGAATESESKAEAAVPLELGWKASTYIDAGGTRNILVEGVVEAPNPGTKVMLEGVPAGLTPNVLVVGIIMEQAEGMWPQVITPVAVSVAVQDVARQIDTVMVNHIDGYTEYVDIETAP